MEDLFYNRRISPMSMHRSQPFDSADYIFELKHDGARCLAYIGDGNAEFVSRNFNSFTATFPELKEINKQIDGRVILDGELILLRDGRADFSAYQERAHIKDKRKIARISIENPAQFVVFDILYRNGSELTGLSLMARKELLNSAVSEGGRLAVSRFIETRGVDFFNIIKAQNLEGVVAKKKDSKYYIGRRSHDWLKIK